MNKKHKLIHGSVSKVAMIHARIETVVATAEQTSFQQTTFGEVANSASEDDLKRLPHIQGHSVKMFFDKAHDQSDQIATDTGGSVHDAVHGPHKDMINVQRHETSTRRNMI